MDFYKIFKNKKPVIGMIHLAGISRKDRINRALKELSIYEEEGVDGAIIEDYYGDIEDVRKTLEASNEFKIVRGINILRDPYLSFQFAKNYDAKFVQFDSIQKKDLDLDKYNELREFYNGIIVLGGVRFKYTFPTGNSLEQDIEDGKLLCDAVVTTGEGTGIETPTKKLMDFKKYMKDFPLIVGAGVNKDNLYEQLSIADGAIIGSYFKSGNTMEMVDRKRVRDLMEIVNHVRIK